MAFQIPALAKVGSFFGRVVTSPWFYAALIVIAVGTGTFFYLRWDKENAVEQATVTATTTANQTATVASLEAQTETQQRTQVIDRNYTRLREQTAKDFTNARNFVETQPVEERDAQAPRVLVDTLNELDRLRQGRADANPVLDAEPPVG